MVKSAKLCHSTVFSLNLDSEGATPFKAWSSFQSSDGRGRNSLSTADFREKEEGGG